MVLEASLQRRLGIHALALRLEKITALGAQASEAPA
jgi:hypothetical protein